MARLLMTRWRVLVLLLTATSLLAAPAQAPASVSIPADRLIQFLNQTIRLYRQTAIQAQIATEPQEQVILYDNRQIADQVVRFAFDFARAQATLIAAENTAVLPSGSGALPAYGALRQMVANLNKNLQDTQAEADSDRKKVAAAAGARRQQLESAVSELQGEMALAQARRDAVENMLEFVSGSGSGSVNGLKDQIEALAASVPAASAGTGSAAQAARSAIPLPPVASSPAPTGIWGFADDLFSLSSKISNVNSMLDQTNELLQTSDNLRSPFLAELRTLSEKGDRLAAQADTAGPASLVQERQQLDALAAQFKQISAALIPLSKQGVLLSQYQKNLVSWRGILGARYSSDLRNLGVRLGGLALLLILLAAVSELWRRAVFRYVRDPRRRRQYLLVRKLVFWIVIGLVVVFTLAGRIGSFFTFAGLLTAGVAVALQNVILSIVGYFFLIGKFGIRVGDRVEVGGTTGEVVEIGLVRFHMMELGAGATPTGRVVAFSNSVVFQASAGLFRQIPGASFAWHQVTLNLPRDADFSLIQKNLLGAVEGVLHDYRAELDRLYGEMEKRGILISERGLRPKLELHVAPGGIDATIRYPVDLQHATDIDGRISQELLTALRQESKLQTPAGPEIHLKTDVPADTVG